MAHKGLIGLLLSPFTSPRIICLQSDPLASALRLQPSAFGPHPSTLNLRPSTSGILPILFDWDTVVVEEKLQLQRRLTCWNFWVYRYIGLLSIDVCLYNIWPNTTKLIQQKGRRVPHR
ncbi:unnamed protein product [Prunus armeniaca]